MVYSMKGFEENVFCLYWCCGELANWVQFWENAVQWGWEPLLTWKYTILWDSTINQTFSHNLSNVSDYISYYGEQYNLKCS